VKPPKSKNKKLAPLESDCDRFLHKDTQGSVSIGRARARQQAGEVVFGSDHQIYVPANKTQMTQGEGLEGDGGRRRKEEAAAPGPCISLARNEEHVEYIMCISSKTGI
jgi:hypothetical protein